MYHKIDPASQSPAGSRPGRQNSFWDGVARGPAVHAKTSVIAG
jgi:hypothetical protein